MRTELKLRGVEGQSSAGTSVVEKQKEITVRCGSDSAQANEEQVAGRDSDFWKLAVGNQFSSNSLDPLASGKCMVYLTERSPAAVIDESQREGEGVSAMR